MLSKKELEKQITELTEEVRKLREYVEKHDKEVKELWQYKDLLHTLNDLQDPLHEEIKAKLFNIAKTGKVTIDPRVGNWDLARSIYFDKGKEHYEIRVVIEEAFLQRYILFYGKYKIYGEFPKALYNLFKELATEKRPVFTTDGTIKE